MTTSPGGQPDKIVHENLRLVDASAKDRFELYQDHPDSDETSFIGFIGYRMAEDAPNVYVLQHTIVAEEYGRQGYARAGHAGSGTAQETGTKIHPSVFLH